MRLKKGFTLAEILIVLMVIGVIATMTVPSMMKGVTETQYKTGFKKAYNTIVNMTAKLGVEGKMPAKVDTQTVETARFFIAMMENLSVREVVKLAHSNRTAALGSDIVGVKYNSEGVDKEFGAGNSVLEIAKDGSIDSEDQYWITTDDGIAYSLKSGKDCSTKGKISTKSKPAEMLDASCLRITVDVNGLSKLPNLKEPQSYGQEGSAEGTAFKANMEPITGDQFDVYVGKDGVTPGSTKYHAGARIVADMK